MTDEHTVLHPVARTLRALVEDRLALDRVEGVAMHLAGCDACRGRLRKLPGGRALLAEMFGAEEKPAPPLTADEATDHQVAVRLVVELRSQDPTVWPALARRDPRFGTAAAVGHLLHVAQEEYHRDLELSDGASAAALAALERWLLADDAPGRRALALGALAWAVRATVLRLTSRLREAERAIAQAWAFADRSGPNRRLESFLCTMEGGVRRDAGDYSAAIELFERAGVLAAACGDAGEAVRAASLVAFCYSDLGEPARAAAILERIRPVLDEIPRSERLKTIVAINLAVEYTRLGRTWEARRLLPEIERRTKEVAEPLTTVRASWIRAMIHHADGEAGHAEHFYREAQAVFLKAGVPQDVALVSLDLAVLFLENDQPARAAEVATELIPIFRDLGIERETLAAGLVLLKALERQEATVDAVRDYAKKLQQSPAWAG